MSDKANNLKNSDYKIRRNIEVETAKQQLELLRRYNTAQTDDERREAIQMMDEDLLDIFIAKQATPVDIIPKLEMAIEKDKFRPRNQSLIWFALDPELEHINGDFSTATFGRKVTPTTDRDTLRTILGQTLSNTKNISKQYAADIIHSLVNLPDDIVQSALGGNNFAYETLFAAIAMDLTRLHGNKKSPTRLEIEVLSGHGPKKTTAGHNFILVNKKTGKKSIKLLFTRKT